MASTSSSPTAFALAALGWLVPLASAAAHTTTARIRCRRRGSTLIWREQGDGAEDLTVRRWSTAASGASSPLREKERPGCHGIDQIELSTAPSRHCGLADAAPTPSRRWWRSSAAGPAPSRSSASTRANRRLKEAKETEELESEEDNHDLPLHHPVADPTGATPLSPPSGAVGPDEGTRWRGSRTRATGAPRRRAAGERWSAPPTLAHGNAGAKRRSRALQGWVKGCATLLRRPSFCELASFSLISS
jgi:hypothetical protein